MKKIGFAPPDITEEDISAVCEVLRSGWLTTGPKTAEFEEALSIYCGATAKCLSSATSALFLALKLFSVGEGDEVITTPYTYAATANVIRHTGAKVVFADIKKDSFNIDEKEVEKKITDKTKAVIAVDFAGMPCNYNALYSVLKKREYLFKPSESDLQQALCRPLLISDSAHSLGGRHSGKMCGSLADMSAFSFHAVKNLTTAEGGALLFSDIKNISGAQIYKRLSLLSLHGQNKDALAKSESGSWFYEIEVEGYKANMTDIQAALGLSQLKRYEGSLAKRKLIFDIYQKCFETDSRFITPFNHDEGVSSYHIYPLRLTEENAQKRALIISEASSLGVSLNVHFIPVIIHPAYKNDFNEKDYPNTMKAYQSEISLPIYTKLSFDDARYIASVVKEAISL